MNLEADRASLANYLRLEFAEEKGRPGALKDSDLEYAGEFIVNGVLGYYWSYPRNGERGWAAIMEYGEYRLSTFADAPPELSEV